MKKLLTMMLALAMLLGCVASFASCGLLNPKPKLDLEKAADALEDEDYNVSYEEDFDDWTVEDVLEELHKIYDFIEFDYDGDLDV